MSIQLSSILSLAVRVIPGHRICSIALERLGFETGFKHMEKVQRIADYFNPFVIALRSEGILKNLKLKIRNAKTLISSVT